MAIQNTTTIPEVKQTIVMLRELSADEKVRTEAYYREKRLHDEASAINSAKREGIAEGLAQGLEQGREEGLAKGLETGLAKGRADGINEIIEKMRRSGMTDEQINLILGVPV